MPIRCGAPGARSLDLPPQAVSPGQGRVTLRLSVSSESEGDGLASDLTHPPSLSDANTARVANRPRCPTATQCSCHRWIHGSA